MRRHISNALLHICGWVDRIPHREDGRWYHGTGCLIGISRLACRIDRP